MGVETNGIGVGARNCRAYIVNIGWTGGGCELNRIVVCVAVSLGVPGVEKQDARVGA